MSNATSNRTKKKKMSKPLKFFILTLLLIFISVGVFFGTYYFMIKKSSDSYENTIKETLPKIENENRRVTELLKNQLIDETAMKNNLPKINDKLSSIKTTLLGEVPTDNYKVSHENLINGLENNVLMYNQMLTVLKSSGSDDMEAALTDLEKYEIQTKEHYNQFSINNLKISMNKESQNFIDIFKKHILEKITSQREEEIKSSQKLEFSQKIDEVISEFIILKVNFSQQLQKARSGSITFQDVLDSVDQYKEKYLSLRKSFSDISTSDNIQKQLYYAFNNILDEYNLFLQEVKFSISSEKIKQGTKPLSELEITEIYAPATEKYNSVEDNYSKFLKSFNEFKSTIK